MSKITEPIPVPKADRPPEPAPANVAPNPARAEASTGEDAHRRSRARGGARTERRPEALADYETESFFVLRSPLLPFSETTLGDADDPENWQAMLEEARRPEVAEALFVASPSLYERLESYDEAWPAKKKNRLRESLARYLQRLRTRSTPFGLFAGGSVGTVSDRTELKLGPRSEYGRHTRLDMDYLYRLAQDLEQDRALRPHLTYFPNSSLYEAAGRLRYAEGRLDGKSRAYHLVAVGRNEFLDAALDEARSGARLDEIAQALCAMDPEGEIEPEDAEDFLHELVDTQILVSDLSPRVTGPEPIHDLIERLSGIPDAQPVVRELRAVREALEGLDHGLGNGADAYRQLGERLGPLGTEVELPRLFQVDMTKPGDGLRLGPEVVAEVRRAVELLHHLRGPVDADAFTQFKEDFRRRYEPGRVVPLVELLDEEIGIGFQRATSIGTEHSPLLAGLGFPPRPGIQEVKWTRSRDLITRKLFETISNGASEVVFDESDLETLGSAERRPLPAAFQAMFSITAPSPEAIDEGEFRLLIKGASGPSGAVVFGRFCHGDPVLAEHVATHLRKEEAHEPDVIHAEVVHLPEGRIGNILLRPVLREHEIAFLGRSGADAENQIPITDLQVTLVGDEVVLLSASRGKRVLPRLTSAHNFGLKGLGIYRFLGALQHQGTSSGLSFPWGPLETLPYLPRVVYGRTVLCRAQWRVEKEELDWCRSPRDERRAKLDAWRHERQIPRRALLADGDNELYVDFEDPLSVDAFAALAKNRPGIRLYELFQDPSALVVEGPEGRFGHELVLPFVRRLPEEGPVLNRPPIFEQRVPAHLPGSEWVYAKLYTGTATADAILEGPVRELLGRHHQALSSWFFLRYADPDFHLRLRFRVPDPMARVALQQDLSALARRLIDEGKAWDLRLDTYKPEIERYGGAEALPLCEEIFGADSRAVLGMLPVLRGDVGAQVRWLAAMASVDGLITGLFDGDLESQTTCFSRMQTAFAHEFSFDANMRKSLGGLLRQKKKSIALALGKGADPESPLGVALGVLDRRNASLAGPMAELRKLDQAGRLDMPLTSLGSSLAHMAVNRLIPAEARAHEAVIYDFLHREMQSREARQRAMEKKAARAAREGKPEDPMQPKDSPSVPDRSGAAP